MISLKNTSVPARVTSDLSWIALWFYYSPRLLLREFAMSTVCSLLRALARFLMGYVVSSFAPARITSLVSLSIQAVTPTPFYVN